MQNGRIMQVVSAQQLADAVAGGAQYITIQQHLQLPASWPTLQAPKGGLYITVGLHVLHGALHWAMPCCLGSLLRLRPTAV